MKAPRKQRATHATVDIEVRVRLTVHADGATSTRLIHSYTLPPLLVDGRDDTAILDPRHATDGPGLDALARWKGETLLGRLLEAI